ncbi:MAG: AMP-binding protein [Candidatus Deferrimicrobiaceae bacterium]
MNDTLPRLLLRNYQAYGDSRVALREKDRGIWISHTWKQYYETVSRLALAFRGMGLAKGDKVAIIGENKPHVYWFELAALSCGAAVMGVFSDCSAEETKYFLNHSDASFVVCQDQEQVDKILAIKDGIPGVKKVIYWEEKGLWNYKEGLLLTMKEMLEAGTELGGSRKGLFEEMVGETSGEDPAALFYSSGTTGIPKAAVQTHRNILRMVEMMDRRHPVRETDESVSFLPIAWIAEQLFNVSYSLWKGFTVNFPEKQETVQEDIRAAGPHVLLLTPRIWEEMIRTVRVKIADAFWLNRACFTVAIRVGSRVGDAEMKGAAVGGIWKALRAVADFCVFRPLRERLGLSRVRLAYTSGTAVSPDVILYFRAIGVPLIQIYGSSECGVATMHPRNQVKPETCGTPLDGYEMTLSDVGEILVRSDCLFKGYYKDPERTARALDGGIYHTGDFGKFDADGHLIVMDRLDDLQRIGSGRVFSPQFAETRIRFSPYVKDVLVVGREGGEAAIALVNIDPRNVGLWAEKRRIVYTTFSDLSQKKEVIELVRTEIAKVNAYLPEWATIGRFLNLHKEFDPDEAEMTRTRKVRREFMERKYQELIDALLGERDRIEVTASVAYRDGSKGNVRSSVLLNDIAGGAGR